jgi:uncharacterized protein YkwD
MRMHGRGRCAAVILGILTVLAGLAITPAAKASRADCAPDPTWPAIDVGWADQVVALVNQYRAARGLSQLGISSSMTNAAAWKARQLANDVNAGAPGANFSHADPAAPEVPSGRAPAARIAACGYGSQFGENIATGQDTPQAAMDAWIASPGHRANLEYPNFSVIGVGAAVGGPAGNAWVQDFGMAPDALQASSAPTAAPLAPSRVIPTAATPLDPPVAAAVAAPVLPPVAQPAAVAPAVRIMRRPRSRTRLRQARIAWATAGPVARVTCALDGAALQRCGSTARTLRSLRSGRHVFRVTVRSGTGARASAYVRWRVVRR